MQFFSEWRSFSRRPARRGREVCTVPADDDWNVEGDTTNYKVRLSNSAAANTCILLRIILQFRSKTFIMIEQPKGSYLWKLKFFREFLSSYPAFFCVLTYLGLDLLKATHVQTNMPNLF